METPTKGTPVQDGLDPDFIWQEYLEETKSVAAPPIAFTHVEYSLESSFKVGMKLEILNSEDKNYYWLATVVMICGELLSLRYAGYGDDRSADFWFDIKSGGFYPVGWCAANNKKLRPPKGVLEKQQDIDSLLHEVLNNVESIPASLTEDLDAGFMPIDQIKCGMKVEIAEELNPQNVWIATILQNIGGRLLLRYDGCKDSSSDMWLFYLSDRLYPVGYAQENNLLYSAPEAFKEVLTDEEWNMILKQSLQEAAVLPFPSHVLEPKLPLEKHSFKEGMKLEAVNPNNYTDICPATVSRVVNDYYFLVTVDTCEHDKHKKNMLCCHSNSHTIFPVKWAEENGLDLKVPKGYEIINSKFSWDHYLKFCNANPAPSELFAMSSMNMGFETGMKLEAADPLSPDNIKVATIERIVDPLMWIRFDSEESNVRIVITSINSFDIYPVGWCATNGYPLQTPCFRKTKPKCTLSELLEEGKTKSHQSDAGAPSHIEQHCKSWCPKIHFNHRCFTGPLLSKSRLAELPQAIGPGPVHLVMKEVLTRVVSIAYKPSRVLQILQIHGKPSQGTQQQVIKAKYKGKSYRATIEIIRHSEQVEEFCKKICTKLECCSYLFGPEHVGEICPSNCHTQTKTKFGYNFVKKHKKPGRPPLHSTLAAENNGEIVKRGPGRKKKRKHWTHLNVTAENNIPQKVPKIADLCETDESAKIEGTKSPSSSEPAKIEFIGKKKLKHTPCSSIVTRGAKLPNFGLWHHVSSFHSRRGRPRTRPMRPFPPRKVGRPVGSTKKAIAAHMNEKKSLGKDNCNEATEEKVATVVKGISHLESNPLEWSVEEVVKYLQKTDCAPLAPLLKDQEIDGQALLMLNIANVQEYLHLKPEPAKKFCYLIKSLKIEFFTHFSI